MTEEVADLIRVGQDINCVFYSEQLPSFSRFDWYLLLNPSKKNKITHKRKVEKSFTKSEEDTGTTGTWL